MTVEPGFGGQAFMPDAAAKIGAVRDDRRLAAGRLEVQVDGGINELTAAAVGALGVDVMVAGSALFRKGRDIAAEIARIRAAAGRGVTGEARAAMARPATRARPASAAATTGSCSGRSAATS